MDLAWLSLAALALVVVLSCVSRANPGIVAIVLALGLALYPPPGMGEPTDFKSLATQFSSELFLTLLGVSLLFAQTEANGTLVRVAQAAQKLCRGQRGLVPLLFFALAAAIGTAGPGNIAAAGLVAPVAMAAAGRARIPPLLMAIAVGHGAIASTLSPFSAAGVTASEKMATIGLVGQEWRVYAWNAAVNGLVGIGAYLLLGGWKLFRRELAEESAADAEKGDSPETATALSPQHWLTLAIIAAMVLAVVGLKVHVGVAAFAGAALVSLLGLADEREAYAKIPWSVIVMVCGVSLLTTVLDKTGGIDRFAQLIQRISTPSTASAVVALVTGLVSIYSSTTGVVIPVFLPMVKSLVAAQPGADALALSLSVLVGGNLVDMSPLSTIGALCLAAAPAAADRRVLFRQLLIYGFVLAFVGAGLCWLWF